MQNIKNFAISTLEEKDFPPVFEIYQAGLDSGQASFEKTAPNWQVFHSKFLAIGRLIIKCGDQTVGWAALSPTSNREVYRGVCEVSIYISVEYQGQGFGTALLSHLIQKSEEAGIWTLQASIFPENQASLLLHKKCGFREVGYRARIALMEFGPMKGRWRDTVLLERRSQKI